MSKLIIIVLIFVSNIHAMTLDSALVNAKWLSKNVQNVKILDVRKQTTTFLKDGHIKGAVLVDDKLVRVTRVIKNKKLTRLIPSQKDFDTFISNLGININDAIIITHQGIKAGNVVGASRLYWHFKVYGYKNVALLDGGNKAWVEDALEDLVKENTVYLKGNFKTTKVNRKIISEINDVKFALKNKKTIIIDTRSLRFYIGIEKRHYVKEYGHIPNTKNFPFKFLTPLKNNTKFFSKNKIKNIFKSMNINYKDNIILYCNSGYEASSVWFVLHEILNNKNVSLYDASLHEWTMSKNNPMTIINNK